MTAAGVAADHRPAMLMQAAEAWASKALALAMNVRHRAYACGAFDAEAGWANDPACGDRLESAWAAFEAHIATRPELT